MEDEARYCLFVSCLFSFYLDIFFFFFFSFFHLLFLSLYLLLPPYAPTRRQTRVPLSANEGSRRKWRSSEGRSLLGGRKENE